MKIPSSDLRLIAIFIIVLLIFVPTAIITLSTIFNPA